MSNEKKWTQGILIGKQNGKYPSMGTWTADDEGDEICCSEVAAITDAKGKVVCLVVDSDEEYFGTSERLEANHARIVDCWNFLADHPDLDKVEVVSKDEIAQLRGELEARNNQNLHDMAELMKLRQQRDELASALKSIMPEKVGYGNSFSWNDFEGQLSACRAALAKVTP